MTMKTKRHTEKLRTYQIGVIQACHRQPARAPGNLFADATDRERLADTDGPPMKRL